MPLFNESYEAQQKDRHHQVMNYVYCLKDSFERDIPVTSIEFNPPIVSGLDKQEDDYWVNLTEANEEDAKLLKGLKARAKGMQKCLEIGAFMSITDSAAGLLRMHNLTMIRLLQDRAFMRRWLDMDPLVFEPARTVIHLTRNHTIRWLDTFLEDCRRLDFRQLLLITGDPLKEVRFRPVVADTAMAMEGEDLDNHRLKNSVELLKYIGAKAPKMYLGAAHNPFMKATVAGKHLLRKVDAGAKFFVTQPVSYYEECWAAIADFEAFKKEHDIQMPVVLGVFNYSVPVGKKGFKEASFEKRYKFWKKLFGWVPDGVRKDYESGLNGAEILARSINKLKRMGYYHFDVMNAEKNGWAVIKNGQRFAHEQDRLTGTFDRVRG